MGPRVVQQGWPAIAVAAIGIVVVACGAAAPSALALGQEAVVEHTVGTEPGVATTLGITVLAVRQGTIEQLEAGGYEIDPEQRELNPLYVDVRWENEGDQTVEREMRISMEDQDGDLISPVVIFNYGGELYADCPDTTEGDLGPGESFESCVLFLVEDDRRAARVSFLPRVPGTETDWVYWAVPE